MTREAVESLSRWFRRNQRPLPWRRTSDPYSIWISEVMLQQTQVTTVLPYYERFLARFPTVEALAAAQEPEVLTLWSGLGYYSRAKNLRRGARHVVDAHGGRFPRDRGTLLAVPGIGPYTAGAILSIAFDLPEPLVDGNVQRVFARFFGWEEPVETGASKAFFWERAREMVALAGRPRDFNQGLMELGATVCVKGAPRCGLCPWQTGCAARRLGREESLPARKPRRDKVDLYWLGLLVEKNGRLLLRRNPPGSWWSDLWDFPRCEVESPRAIPAAVNRLARQWKGRPEALGTARHTVTHHRIHVTAYRVPAAAAAPRDCRWFSRAEIGELPLSSLARKLLRTLDAASGRDPQPNLPL